MLPAGQRPVVARALAGDPQDRWPDCLAFVQELIRAGTAVEPVTVPATVVEPVQTLPEPGKNRSSPRASRGRGVAAAALAVVLALAVGRLSRHSVEPGERLTAGVAPDRPLPAGGGYERAEDSHPVPESMPTDEAPAFATATPSAVESGAVPFEAVPSAEGPRPDDPTPERLPPSSTRVGLLVKSVATAAAAARLGVREGVATLFRPLALLARTGVGDDPEVRGGSVVRCPVGVMGHAPVVADPVAPLVVEPFGGLTLTGATNPGPWRTPAVAGPPTAGVSLPSGGDRRPIAVGRGWQRVGNADRGRAGRWASSEVGDGPGLVAKRWGRTRGAGPRRQGEPRRVVRPHPGDPFAPPWTGRRITSWGRSGRTREDASRHGGRS